MARPADMFFGSQLQHGNLVKTSTVMGLITIKKVKQARYVISTEQLIGKQ